MITVLRCRQHGIVAVIDGNTRSFQLPPGVRSANCGLLQAANPQPGQLVIRDQDGTPTTKFCDVEAEA